MKVLVTGSAGFIGSSCAAALVARGDTVVGVDSLDAYYPPAIKRLNVERLAHARFQFVEGDIREPALLDRLFRQQHFDAVAHCAARAGVRPSLSDPLLYEDMNVAGTIRLLEAVRTHGVSNTVVCSSSSVYGNNPKVPFSEDDNVDRPISPYAATKKAMELHCHTYHHLYGLSITCLRLFTVYGPRQRPEMAIHQMTRRIDLGLPVAMYGDGSSLRDYTYIDDLVDGLCRALDRPLGYEVINLGEERTVALKEMIATIEAALGKPAIIRSLPAQPGDVERTYADISKARRLLGYHPTTEFREGIRRFVDWYRVDGRAWLQHLQDER
jgi:UDP-glucuronate 4-epimerase